MERYNKRKHRERIEASSQVALAATRRCFNWTKFYTDLYARLDLEEYLPTVLAELNRV
jgi:hypothetical protein